jgi:hypothetical protein
MYGFLVESFYSKRIAPKDHMRRLALDLEDMNARVNERGTGRKKGTGFWPVPSKLPTNSLEEELSG